LSRVSFDAPFRVVATATAREKDSMSSDGTSARRLPPLEAVGAGGGRPPKPMLKRWSLPGAVDELSAAGDAADNEAPLPPPALVVVAEWRLPGGGGASGSGTSRTWITPVPGLEWWVPPEVIEDGVDSGMTTPMLAPAAAKVALEPAAGPNDAPAAAGRCSCENVGCCCRTILLALTWPEAG
jgi:hypothetical protein